MEEKNKGTGSIPEPQTVKLTETEGIWSREEGANFEVKETSAPNGKHD